MSEKNRFIGFIGNPDKCAKDRLIAAGFSIDETLLHEGREYTGAWVTRKLAGKVWQNCARQTRGQPAFHLFHKVGVRSAPVKIEAAAAASNLGVQSPYQPSQQIVSLDIITPQGFCPKLARTSR